MSKSILVIDTPKSCVECPLKSQLYDIQYICTGNHRRMVIPSSKNKPDWCPLKNVPEKKEMRNFCLGERDFIQQGWNTCIEEIHGENK